MMKEIDGCLIILFVIDQGEDGVIALLMICNPCRTALSNGSLCAINGLIENSTALTCAIIVARLFGY